ncbi:hypothetical protein BKA70DRAFT_1358168 [Coprinopsis sp. MPI-PUGE-AT-0042]|nr:hypothetical protein BKA70DRAFT_1358168 [Coprinopsis sp. MPI-PUGE-AT-0042]
MRAAWGGHKGTVKLLLAHPVIQVSLKTKHRSTALLLAAQSGCDTLVELLLATGAFDVNMAADRGFEAVVRLLLGTPNIDITIRSTRDGHTALSAAQANGHNVIAKLLQDFLSRTPAVRQRDSDSGSGDAFYDAEEGTEDEVDFS